MEWLDRLRGAVVGLDTAPLIYYVERNLVYTHLVRPLFGAIARDEFQVVTSVVTLAEVLVHPLRTHDSQLIENYRALLLHSQHIITLAIHEDIAERTAYLRANYRLRTPDAIQLATTLHMGGTNFITNDEHLPDIPGLNILVLKHLLVKTT